MWQSETVDGEEEKKMRKGGRKAKGGAVASVRREG